MSDDELVHWWSPEGATHAVHDVSDWHGTIDVEAVTCDTCRAHIKERA
jgi:hypothetical protein